MVFENLCILVLRRKQPQHWNGKLIHAGSSIGMSSGISFLALFLPYFGDVVVDFLAYFSAIFKL